jgi:hypothetical protein
MQGHGSGTPPYFATAWSKGVGVGYAQPREQCPLQLFHDKGFGLGLVVKAKSMKGAVSSHMKEVITNTFTLLLGLLDKHRQAENKIGGCSWKRLVAEGKNIGW